MPDRNADRKARMESLALRHGRLSAFHGESWAQGEISSLEGADLAAFHEAYRPWHEASDGNLPQDRQEALARTPEWSVHAALLERPDLTPQAQAAILEETMAAVGPDRPSASGPLGSEEREARLLVLDGLLSHDALEPALRSDVLQACSSVPSAEEPSKPAVSAEASGPAADARALLRGIEEDSRMDKEASVRAGAAVRLASIPKEGMSSLAADASDRAVIRRFLADLSPLMEDPVLRAPVSAALDLFVSCGGTREEVATARPFVDPRARGARGDGLDRRRLSLKGQMELLDEWRSGSESGRSVRVGEGLQAARSVVADHVSARRSEGLLPWTDVGSVGLDAASGPSRREGGRSL